MLHNDESALFDAWAQKTKCINSQIGTAFSEIQEHAYELGYKHGLSESNPGYDTKTAEAVLNACISYVIHGDADFEGMHEGLVSYFKKNVKSRLKSPKKKKNEA